MKLQIFDGGLSVRLAPQYIETTQATVYMNVDNSSGELSSVKSSTESGILVDENHAYFQSNNEWVSFDETTYSAEYQNILYVTNGIDAPRKYSDGTFSPLGISAPGNKPRVEWDHSPTPVTYFSSSVEYVDDGLQTAIVYYLIINTDGDSWSTATYARATAEGLVVLQTGVSEPSSPTVVDERGDEDLSVEFDDFDPAVNARAIKIYRYYNDVWYFVGEWAGVGDNSNVVDNVWDISDNDVLDEDNFPNLFGIMQYAYTFYDSVTGNESAPSEISDEVDTGDTGVEHVTIYNMSTPSDLQIDTLRLYRIGNDLTVFTLVEELELGEDALFSYDDRISDIDVDGRLLTTTSNGVAPEGLKYIIEAYAMLWGAVGTRLYFTPIGEPDNWPALYFIDFSLEITGIAPVGSGILVFSLYASEIVLGTGPSSLSKQPVAGDQGCLAHKSIQLIGSSAIWISTDGICVSSGGDVEVISKNRLGKLGFLPKDSALHDQVYYVVDYYSNVLAADFRYGTAYKRFNLDVSQLSVGEDKLYGWYEGQLLELFSGDEDEEFEYMSPRFFEGQATKSKLYKSLYIYLDGNITVTIYINDEAVITKTFVGKDNFEIKIPQTNKRGYYIQLGITGTGTVREIYWEAAANE